jgi:hypothetical protein
MLFDNLNLFVREPVKVIDDAVYLTFEGRTLVFVVRLILVGLRLR